MEPLPKSSDARRTKIRVETMARVLLHGGVVVLLGTALVREERTRAITVRLSMELLHDFARDWCALRYILKRKCKRDPDFCCRVFIFRVFFLLVFWGVHRNRRRVFIIRGFVFCFASKALAVGNIRHSRPLRPHSFGHCLLTARQFMRGVQLPRGSWHFLRSSAI